MLIFDIFAIVLSIVIFCYFLLNRQARSKQKNHGWLILLIMNFFQLILDLPMPMSYYYLGTVWPTSNIYCTWWIWCEYSVNSISLFLMAWISIERHIIIFHPHAMLHASWRKRIFHFLIPIFCLIWAPLFFFVVVVINPQCTNVWDYNLITCGIPCYFTINILVQFDFIFDIVFPIIIIMIANLTLVIRVLSRRQAVNWRRHRKMVLQLWIVSSLYMGFWLPTTITQLIQMTIMPTFMIDQLATMQFVIYFIPLLLPMICLSALPELVKKIMDFIRFRRRNVINVVTFNRDARQTVPIVIVR
ncbi:unnamed protein product [Adineta steineri]|uniref:G-protein coupled receptors family 1 profile domain-containing protein n=3 Tax=Adineta steineri TaxID=433720 RepID=A0A819M0I5_9BILA|nr:unnamed protein product [Adineta steineri]CAF3971849.1 unnamed protein product [Adineta steineri]